LGFGADHWRQCRYGVAVILLTILIRVLMLPLSLAGMRTEKERREISHKMKELEEKHSAEPVVYDEEKRKVIKTNKRILISEIINLVIQVMIALMLWRIFATGLSGEDIHYIYPSCRMWTCRLIWCLWAGMT
jgi:YidC/Oxa1 family membrane protein insertase